MVYRSGLEGLERRLSRVQHELDAIPDLAVRKKELTRELLEIRQAIKAMHDERALPVLQSPRIFTPCREPWDAMVGDAHERFCRKCSKPVYNLSAMTRTQAALLLEQKTGACVRYYERPDGTLMASDCPIGRSDRRTTRTVAGVLLGTVIAAVGWVAATWALPDAEPLLFRSVDELLDNRKAVSGRVVRAEGELVHGSLEKDGGGFRFALSSRGATLPVRYGLPVLPDPFVDRDDMPIRVLVEGKLLEDGDFLAVQAIPLVPHQGYTLKDRREPSFPVAPVRGSVEP
jgi:cytochrome c-type biogenesis protein CcmE